MKSLSEQWKNKKKELNDFFTPDDLVNHIKQEIDKQIIVKEIADYTGGGGALLKPFNCKKIYNEYLKEYYEGTPNYDIKTNEDFLSDYPFEKSQVVFLNPPFEKKDKIGVRMACKGYDLAKEFYILIYSPSLRYVQRFKEERDYLTKDKHLYRIEETPAKTFSETNIPLIVMYFDKRKTTDKVLVIKGDYSEEREQKDAWNNIFKPIGVEEEKVDIKDLQKETLMSFIKQIETTIELYEVRKKYFNNLTKKENLFLQMLKSLNLNRLK